MPDKRDAYEYSHVKVWDFHEGFPQGFTGLAKEAAKYGGGIGLWMSPWGGYGKVKQTRLIHGREAGFETNKNGFSMAGNSYRTHFLNTGLRMVRQYRANFFKFDGMGGGNSTDGADTAYANDMDAILNVVIDRQRVDPIYGLHGQRRRHGNLQRLQPRPILDDRGDARVGDNRIAPLHLQVGELG